ncbi:electron transport complex subunit RsxC [bacterium]|nr:electron transport complex subunit RsxC [bacterium]
MKSKNIINLQTFTGGIHPHLDKSLTGRKKFKPIKLPSKVRLPLSQHIGAPSKPVVKVGDIVKEGQVIAEASGFVSVPLHASISGKITAIKKFPVCSGKHSMCIEITNTETKTEINSTENTNDWKKFTPDQLKTMVEEAGIVGLGGAAFPTHVKLSPPNNKKIDIVIGNGVECEPYLDADRNTMVSSPDKVIGGIQIVMKILGCGKGAVGIESDTPDAINAMSQKTENISSINIVPLKLKYPQGAEKQLIYAVTKKEVPCGGLPMDVGVVVINVGTAVAIYDAVVYSKPLYERNMTIAGNCLNESVNINVRVGALLNDIIDEIGGFKTLPSKIILGGPMMGQTVYLLDIPVTKGTSGILCLNEKEISIFKMGACIRCGKCLDICPMGISPAQIAQAIEFNNTDIAQQLGVFDCMECGCCTYVCPSNREIVQLIKLAKQQIKNKG